MKADLQQHPHDEELAEFLNGELDPVRSIAVGLHVRHCPECRQVLRAILAEA